ncbi:MAG: universal stress protein [Halobacteriales archaeon]
MYEVILFPTDGSDHATAALPHAIEHADRYGATLDVLYAAGDEGDGEDVVEAAADRARDAGLEVNTAVVQGPPDEVIVDYVADRGVDMVVMGSQGRGGLDRLVVGSVTESVLRRLEVPMLVVPDGG